MAKKLRRTVQKSSQVSMKGCAALLDVFLFLMKNAVTLEPLPLGEGTNELAVE
jgi:hypothetical protein